METKIREKLCSVLAFFMVYAFAFIVWMTNKENFMILVLFFLFVATLVIAYIMNASTIEYIFHILTVPEVTK